MVSCCRYHYWLYHRDSASPRPRVAQVPSVGTSFGSGRKRSEISIEPISCKIMLQISMEITWKYRGRYLNIYIYIMCIYIYIMYIYIYYVYIYIYIMYIYIYLFIFIIYKGDVVGVESGHTGDANNVTVCHGQVTWPRGIRWGKPHCCWA